MINIKEKIRIALVIETNVANNGDANALIDISSLICVYGFIFAAAVALLVAFVETIRTEAVSLEQHLWIYIFLLNK